MEERSEKYQKDYHTSMSYTELTCGHELLDIAEARLQHSFDVVNHYQSHKFSPTQWYVQRLNNNKGNAIYLVPNFIRTRTVTYNVHKKLLWCNCPRKDVYEDICPHVAHVAKNIPGYTQPSIKDISIVWTAQYSH